MRQKNQNLNQALIELATSDKFVIGVCSFCDRWCVRCPKSTKCLSYAYGLTIKGLHPRSTQDDQQNEEFWRNFETRGRLYVDKYRSLGKEHAVHPGTEDLMEICVAYEKLAKTWLSKMEFDTDTQDSEAEKASLSAEICLEIIDWYCTLIPFKTERALKELNIRIDRDLNNKKNPYRDNIGTAKLLLIACRRTLYALGILAGQYEFNFQNQELELIAHLIQIENKFMLIFPNAWEFIRTGQDD